MNKPATDFNDLARSHGNEAVRSAIANAKRPTETLQGEQENTTADDSNTVAATIDKLSDDVGAALELDILEGWRRLR